MSWFNRKPKKEKKAKPQPIFKTKRVVEAVQVDANTVRYVARKVQYIPATEEDYWESAYPTHSSYGSTHIGFNQTRRTYPSYVNNEPKKEFAWTPSKWSNFTFSSFYEPASDDNSNLFVKDPDSYRTPTIAEIKAKVNAYSKESLETIKEAARVCYFKMLDDRDYMNPNYKANSSDEYDKKKKLYDSIFDTYIPGFTPLEQAIAIHWQLNDEKAKRNKVNEPGNKGARNTVEFKREDYADPALNSQLIMNTLSNKHKMEILNKVSIIGELGYQFKVEKEVGETEVHFSEITGERLMNSHSELSCIDLYQRLLPNFENKFYTKDLIVNIPVESSEKKQKLIIICDYSGSMDDDEKQIWVNSILIDRFRYVIKGEAEVFFSFFVSSTSSLKFTHVKNEDDVIRFWKSHSNRPSGSMTDIGRIVSYIKDEVERGRLHNLHVDLSKEKPEILIINDGQDRVGYDKFPYKVNAISLIDFSDELKKLCIGSGGKQVRISSGNRIKSYAKEDGIIVEKDV